MRLRWNRCSIIFADPKTKDVYTRKVDYKFRTGNYGVSDILLNITKKGLPGWAHKDCKKQNDLIINVNVKNRVACLISSKEIWKKFDELDAMPKIDGPENQKNVAVKWERCKELFPSFTLSKGF